jgi:hypothetical protein
MVEKANVRDGQREVAGDKGQWSFVLQGMRPAAEARSRSGQRKVVGDKEQGVLFCKGETSCGSGCRRSSSYHSPIFSFLKREGEEKGWVLEHSLILWLLLADGGGGGAAHVLKWGP